MQSKFNENAGRIEGGREISHALLEADRLTAMPRKVIPVKERRIKFDKVASDVGYDRCAGSVKRCLASESSEVGNDRSMADVWYAYGTLTKTHFASKAPSAPLSCEAEVTVLLRRLQSAHCCKR